MQTTVKSQLIEIFTNVNELAIQENNFRKENSSLLLQKCNIQLLGQTSLMAQPDLTYNLNLIQTGDVDALIQAEYFYKSALKKILPDYGFIYDEDSPYIFIPKNSKFNSFLSLSMISVEIIDPESALVSKAVKAPVKNKFLIREAISKNIFKNLSERIIENGGNLADFI